MLNVSKEAREKILEYQADPKKSLRIANIAQELAESFKGELPFEPSDVGALALIAEIGKKHPNTIVEGKGSIYSKEYGPWDDVAKDINKQQGEFSIEMATDLGIELTDEQKESIKSVTAGKTVNLMALFIKCVQTYQAVQNPRWSRGVKKEAAKDFEEVNDILKEEMEFMTAGLDMADQDRQTLIDNILDAFSNRKDKIIKDSKWLADYSAERSDLNIGSMGLTNNFPPVTTLGDEVEKKLLAATPAQFESFHFTFEQLLKEGKSYDNLISPEEQYIKIALDKSFKGEQTRENRGGIDR